jgi:peptidoglycan/LPS O-acetylase OafA/YrhL
VAGSVHTYHPAIDGLRAIAVGSVVGYHVGLPFLPGGFVGVDVFFVISGYLITRLLVDEYCQTGRIKLLGFYARRARRLLPAFIVVALTTLILGAFVLLPIGEEQPRLVRSVKYATAYISNFYFARTTGGYFDSNVNTLPMLHTWSLSVEEQFYVVWPLLILTMGAVAQRVRWSKLGLITIALITVSLLSLTLSIHHSTSDMPAARAHYYLTTARAWELGIGALVALLVRRFGDAACASQLRGIGGLGAIGLAVILSSVALLDHTIPFPGSAALAPTLGTAALIFSQHVAPASYVAKLLSVRAMVGIGLLSYGWYLWHWPLLAFYRIHAVNAAEPLALLAIGLGSLMLAAVTYQVVERPMRERRVGATAGHGRTLATAVAASMALVLAAEALKSFGPLLHKNPAYARAAAAFYDAPAGCMQTRPFTGLRAADGCGLTLPTAAREPTILVFGDSHADMIGPMVNEALASQSMRTVYRSFSGCAPVLGYTRTGANRYRECATYMDAVLREIETKPKGQLAGVVLAATWIEYLRQESQILETNSQADKSPSLQNALGRMLDALARHDVKVAIIGPVPSLRHPAIECLLRRPASDCNAARPDIDVERAKTVAKLNASIAGRSNVRYLDPIEQFCDMRLCYAERDGAIVYRDNNHITATAARRLAGWFSDTATWLGSRDGR